MLAVSLALFFLKDALLGSEVVRRLPVTFALFTRMGVLVVYYAVLVALLVHLVRRRGQALLDAFRLRPRLDPRTWPSAAALVVGALIATRIAALVYYGLVASNLGFRPTAGASGLTAVFGSGPVGLALSVLLVVVVAPVVEELVFRGVVLDALRQRLEPRIAIVGAALLFAAFHFDPWQVVPTALLGAALGWLAWRRETLWPAIAVHALYNASIVSVAFYATGR